MNTAFRNSSPECPGKSGAANPKWAVALWLSLTVLAALAPVWLSSTLPTSDGGSHVYNAMIAHEVRNGKSPFDARYILRVNPRSDFASDSTLRVLGPLFGWENAERILASLILIVSGLLFYSITRKALSSDYAALIAAWLANNWFFWMGFYDFSLSIAAFAGLVIAFRNSEEEIRWPWIGVSLFALYATHLFTFALGTALFIWVLLWRVGRRKTRALWLTTAMLPVGLMIYELTTGPVGRGGVSWGGWKAFERAFTGWLIGDFLITFSWIGLVVGAAVMLVTWAGLVRRIRLAIFSRRWDPIDLFAVAAFAGSLIVPDHIGAGLYTAARMRFITVILLLPSTAVFLSASSIVTAARSKYVVMVALLTGLILQAGWIVRVSHFVTEEEEAIERTLRVAGVTNGAWVTSVLMNARTQALRIQVYAHVPERAYLRLGVCGLENYEAALGNFEVQWRRPPDTATILPSNSGWIISRNVQGLHWQGGLWVLHDAVFNISLGDRALYIVSETAGGPYRVTRVEAR
jgi:hypothetical protein